MFNQFRRGVYFTSLIIFTSCNTPPDGAVASLDNSQPEIIRIPSQEQENLNLWNDIQVQKIIPLETSEESLLSAIRDIQFKNGHYFVLNQNRKNLFVFDSLGRFKNQIGKIGRGPGEHKEIPHFFTTDDFVYVSSITKLAKYNWSGDLIKENSLYSYALQDFSVVEDSLFLYYTIANSGEMDFHNVLYHLLLKDFNGEVKTKYLRYGGDKSLIDLRPNNNNIFTTSTGETRIVYHTNDTIFTISTDVISHTYVVDFGNDKLPENAALNEVSKFDDWKEKEYAFNVGITSISETSDYLYFTYIHGSKLMHAVYNKRKQSTKIYDSFSIDNQEVSSKDIVNELFIGVLYPDDLNEYHFENIDSKESSPINIPKIGDNPVLIVYKFNN